MLQKIKVKKPDIFDQAKIATEFTRFFANVDLVLAKQLPESKNTFQSYLVKPSAKMQHKSVSMSELRAAFFSFKLNKSPVYDEISFNALRNALANYASLRNMFSIYLLK